MSISIVIPSLNAPTIQATLDSVYQQRGLSEIPEIIVVGQDSERRIRAHPHMRFIETSTPLLPGAARNLGVAHSSGQILVFLDADIILLPDALRWLCARVQEYGIVGGSIILEPGNYWQLARNIMSFSFCTSDMPFEQRDHVPSMLLGCQRQVWLQVGAFREDLWVGEDVEWGLRAGTYGRRVMFDPAICSYHRPALLPFYRHWQRWQHYGYGWGKVYQQVFRGTDQFPLYTPRARTEYLWRIGQIAQQRSPLWPGLILLVWVLTVTVRDTLIVYVRRAGVRVYWHTAPGLWLLTLAWYIGLLRYVRSQETRD